MRDRLIGLAFAGVLLVLGTWLTIEELSWGSSHATSRAWATIGPILAGFGVALVLMTFPKQALTSATSAQRLPKDLLHAVALRSQPREIERQVACKRRWNSSCTTWPDASRRYRYARAIAGANPCSDMTHARTWPLVLADPARWVADMPVGTLNPSLRSVWLELSIDRSEGTSRGCP